MTVARLIYILCLLTLSPPAFSEYKPDSGADLSECAIQLRSLVPYKKGSGILLDQTDVLLENTRVYPAVLAAAEAYRKQGLKLPPFRMLPDDPHIGTSSRQHWDSLPVEVTAEVPLTKKIKGGTGPVYDVTIEGKRYVFREIDEYRDLRLTIAAAALNQMVGIGTVPPLKVGKINGKLGALSRFEDGAKLPQLNQGVAIGRLIQGGKLNVESYNDAKAFEFLVGNNDAKRIDTIVRADGTVVSVDHNYAFTRGLNEYFPNEVALGPVLPETYSKKWIEFVSRTKRGGSDPNKRRAFVAAMTPYLSAAERDAVLFRLEVIAADMERK